MSTRRDPLDEWADELAAQLVEPLSPAGMEAIAAAAATAAGATTAAVAAGAATAGAISTAAKVAVTAALVTALGAAGAATGALPDPIQEWVADLVDGIGIDLPRPSDPIDLPRDLPGPPLTVPEVRIPGVDPVQVEVPGLETPRLDAPALEVPDAGLPELEQQPAVGGELSPDIDPGVDLDLVP